MVELSGFLLTRHWRDTPEGVDLTFWIHTREGPVKISATGQQAVCFIAREDRLPPGFRPDFQIERKPLELTDLHDQPVDGLYFSQQRHLQRLRAVASESGLMLYESDIKPADRYLMERFITATLSAAGHMANRSGYRELNNPRLSPSACKPAFSYLSLDIETDGLEGEILSIAYCGQGTEEILMQGIGAQWPADLPIRWFPDERTLLLGLFDRIFALDPDLILGWNVINFDLEYIGRRCGHHRIPFRLGRGGETAAVLAPQQTGQNRIASIPGRVVLDGIDNLRAAFWSFESFSLNHVAGKLLGKGKLIENQEGRVEEIRRLFLENRPALAAYNLEDCRLVEEIFRHTELIDFATQKALMTGLSLGRQGGSVAAFDNLYLPRLHRRGAVAHDVGDQHFDTTSPGGYVMDSQPGLYDNVLVLDFKSLYPSIIRTFHIDPLGMARPGTDPIPGFLDAGFSRDETILPGIIADLWEKRDVAKQVNNRPLSQAIKIIMNSFYGVLGSNGCRFYNPGLASSITRRGHQIITESRDWLESQGHRVIYGDTDSLFVHLGSGLEEEQAIEKGHGLARNLNAWWRDRIQREFRTASFLEVEFETHFIRFLMPTIRGSLTGSKKRYAGTVRTAAGDFSIVFKGLESVRSDWTPLARSFQQELYRRIFFNKPYRSYIMEITEQLKRGELNDQLVYRKRLRRPLDSYQRNIPPHVQAARKSGLKSRWVKYFITLNGPEPLDNTTSPLDYRHYLERQLAPAADGILYFLDESFEHITAEQMDLF